MGVKDGHIPSAVSNSCCSPPPPPSFSVDIYIAWFLHQLKNLLLICCIHALQDEYMDFQKFTFWLESLGCGSVLFGGFVVENLLCGACHVDMSSGSI